jgi:hypothetical protein
MVSLHDDSSKTSPSQSSTSATHFSGIVWRTMKISPVRSATVASPKARVALSGSHALVALQTTPSKHRSLSGALGLGLSAPRRAVPFHVSWYRAVINSTQGVAWRWAVLPHEIALLLVEWLVCKLQQVCANALIVVATPRRVGCAQSTAHRVLSGTGLLDCPQEGGARQNMSW